MTPGVDEAMRALPRDRFLPEEQRPEAGLDAPLPIGWGQTNSQPTTVRNMLTLLCPAPGDQVLDVGCGSGWSTALLAYLVGAEGSVLGVERVPELTAVATQNVAGLSMPWAEVHQASPHVLGLPEYGPYDRILVSAGIDELPAELVAQLSPGAVMVIPVGSELIRVVKGEGSHELSRHGRYNFVPLLTGSPPPN